MWPAKTWRDTQEFGGYQTDLGMFFNSCCGHIPQAHIGSRMPKFLLKRKKQVEREIPELVFLALYKHCLRKIHFKSIGKLMGNRNKEVGNSTLLAGESPWQRKFKAGYFHIPKQLQSWACASVLFPKSCPTHRRLSSLWTQTEPDCSSSSA